MPWAVLILAGLLETVWAVCMKASNGFTRLWPSVWTVASMAASVGGLAWSLKWLPVGTAYAVWTGIGAAATAIFGMWFLGEPKTALRMASLVLLLAGIVGLKVASA
ncbi:MAG: multidrug efflux SMR transporter [Holophagaceae bacterium]|nr:multidrug efflux SMR transporter [Holophagaceae bacterium]